MMITSDSERTVEAYENVMKLRALTGFTASAALRLNVHCRQVNVVLHVKTREHGGWQAQRLLCQHEVLEDGSEIALPLGAHSRIAIPTTGT